MSGRCVYGDNRETMRAMIDAGERVQMCVTSPPYFGLRSYLDQDSADKSAELGSEPTVAEYVANMVGVFRLVRELLADDGVVFLNLGDSYAGSWGAQGRTGSTADRSVVSARQIDAHPQTVSGTGTIRDAGLKPKDLIGIPWRVAFALQADGWYLRSDIIWAKPNPMPESVTDRPTKAHEYLFLLSKRERYYYDAAAIAEAASEDSGFAKQRARGVDTWQYGRTAGGNTSNGIGGTFGTEGTRNRRTVWTVATQPYSGAHFATFPPALIEPCILAGSREGDVVFDPFLGSGTTGEVATRLGRRWLGCELNEDYRPLIEERTAQLGLPLAVNA